MVIQQWWRIGEQRQDVLIRSRLTESRKDSEQHCTHMDQGSHGANLTASIGFLPDGFWLGSGE